MKNRKKTRQTTIRPARHLLMQLLIVLILSLTFLNSFVYADLDWQVSLRVESGATYNRLVIGADDTATDGYDNLWDTYALMGGQIEAFFPHPEWGQTHIEYQRDIRAHSPAAPIEWTMTIDSTLPAGSTFNISWTFLNVPPDYQVTLINEANNDHIDMQLTSSYQFVLNGTSSFRITVNETTACLHQPARILESQLEFSTLQEAYNTAAPGQTILTLSGTLSQNLTLNQNKALIIRGGYDCNYENVVGTTTLNGLFINDGSANIENFIIH